MLTRPSDYSRLGNPKANATATGDAFKTLFVGRLPYEATETHLQRTFERYGPIVSIVVVRNAAKGGASRGYAFVEFAEERDLRTAFAEADGMRLEGISGTSGRIVVDVERGRTVSGWRPRRLGGGLGGTRIGGRRENVVSSGRDPRTRVAAKAPAPPPHVRHGGPDREQRGRERSPAREYRRRSPSRENRRSLEGDRHRHASYDRDDRHSYDRQVACASSAPTCSDQPLPAPRR